jgi:hypothetical protein
MHITGAPKLATSDGNGLFLAHLAGTPAVTSYISSTATWCTGGKLFQKTKKASLGELLQATPYIQN